MHYYKRNIGDYSKKAGRLSILQHGIYNLLIDACYDREKFPTTEEAIDWVWASSKEEIEGVEFVLRKFFIKQDDGTWVQNRIKEEIEDYQTKAEINKQIAIDRETKRKGKDTNRDKYHTNRSPVVNEPPPNQEPITNNQEPLTNTTAGSVCKKLHELQIQGINPSHPDLLKLLDAGCTEQEIVDMASNVKVKKFAYVLGAVASAREQAASKTVVKGDFGKKEKAWYITASGIEDKAKELCIDTDRPFPAIKLDVFKRMKITSEMVSKAQADADGKRA